MEPERYLMIRKNGRSKTACGQNMETGTRKDGVLVPWAVDPLRSVWSRLLESEGKVSLAEVSSALQPDGGTETIGSILLRRRMAFQHYRS